MADLNSEQQKFVVIQLARGSSPTEVVELVKEAFDIDVTRQQVRYYNPEQSEEVKEEWKELFRAERERFIEDARSVPVFHQAVRLRRLQQIIEKARTQKNYRLEKETLEQVAREVGGLYTNTRKITGDPRAALAEFLGVEPSQLPQPPKKSK